MPSSHERQAPVLFVEADVCFFGWRHETAAGAEAARDTPGTLCVSPSTVDHSRGPTLGLESSDWHSASQGRDAWRLGAVGRTWPQSGMWDRFGRVSR